MIEPDAGKLKTLKDFNLCCENSDCKRAEFILKQEAIKWVKDCPCERVKVKIIDDNEPERQEIHRNYCFACLRFINFFNLTEEDLK